MSTFKHTALQAAFIVVTLCLWYAVELASVRSYAVPTEPLSKPVRCAKLLFTGDVMVHTPQIMVARTVDGYDFERTFRYVKPYFERADLTVVNFETTLSDDGNYSGYPCFSSPVQIADALRDAGVDVALLANNHCLDRSLSGLRRTRDNLTSRSILCTGAAADSLDYKTTSPLVVEIDSIRFAILNYTYATNGIAVPHAAAVSMIDTVQIGADIVSARRSNVDCIIACMHWGNEYERHPSHAQRHLARWLHARGVRIVVGSHPHVIQPFAVTAQGVTLYSLGNFVSNQHDRYTDGGLMAEIDVCRRDTVLDVQLHLIPVWVKRPHYEILPLSVADTIEMSAAQRARYEQFKSDTNSLLQL